MFLQSIYLSVYLSRLKLSSYDFINGCIIFIFARLHIHNIGAEIKHKSTAIQSHIYLHTNILEQILVCTPIVTHKAQARVRVCVCVS